MSLEFATQMPTGMIFYNGRLNDENDFVSLELTDSGRTLHFKFSTGGGGGKKGNSKTEESLTLTRQNEKPFSDGNFHRVNVVYVNKTATISGKIQGRDIEPMIFTNGI